MLFHLLLPLEISSDLFPLFKQGGQKKKNVLKIFKLLYFPLPLFFPFLAITDFIEAVD